jgi:hypothetical protein
MATSVVSPDMIIKRRSRAMTGAVDASASEVWPAKGLVSSLSRDAVMDESLLIRIPAFIADDRRRDE